MNEDSALDPTLLAELDEEINIAKKAQRNKFMPRVACEKGQSVLIRLLPVEYPNSQWPFFRFAQHWVGKKFISCKTKTSPHLGGDPNHICPVCAIVEKLATHPNKTVQDKSARGGAAQKWFFVCLVLAKDIGQGAITVGSPDCWVAHEWSVFQDVFQPLVGFFKKAYSKECPRSITDFTYGTNIWVSRTEKKGTSLQPLMPSALAKDEHLQDTVNLIWKSIIIPKIDMPSPSQEQEFAVKIKDYAFTADAGSGQAPPPSINARPQVQAQDFNEEAELGMEQPKAAAIAPPPATAAPSIKAPAAVRPPPPPGRKAVSPPPVQTTTAIQQAEAIQAPPAIKPQVLPGAGQGVSESDEEEGTASEAVDVAPPAPSLPPPETAPQTPPAMTPPTIGGTKLGARLRENLAKIR